MSSALPYLQKMRKSELTEFAETSNLKGYSTYRKPELEAALDEHLRSNSTRYAREPSLSEYYKRLDVKHKSPVKKIAEKVSDLVKSDDDGIVPTTVKKVRRKTQSIMDDVADPDGVLSTFASKAERVASTVGNELVQQSQDLVAQIPASPGDVADAIDVQTRRLRNSISRTYERSQLHEWSDYARELLSSSVTITLLGLLIEAYGLRAEILPNKLLTELPPLPYLKSTKTPITVPDLFLLLTTSFWAPFTLWVLTSMVLPAMVSYFINLPLKQLPHHNYATRRASIRNDPRKQFDPFVFSLAKGLISYLVLVQHVQFAGLFQHYTVALVNNAIPGGYRTIVASTGLAAAVSMYEAILRK